LKEAYTDKTKPGKNMGARPKILIVDDYIDNIYVIEELLSELDVEPVRAMSGAEAIRKIEQQEYALVLMDIQMPDMNGFETVENIRKNSKNRLLNIIFVTAVRDEVANHIKGIKTGAIDFMTKPLIPEVFTGKVNSFINLYRERKRLEEEIRKRKEIEAELQKSREQSEEAVRVKQQFLSTISHEIRTPLNAIVNTVNFLLYEEPRSDQLENVEILRFSAENLLQLVNGVLEYSKLDAGKIEFESIDFDFRKLMSSIRQSFEPDATGKGLVLEFQSDEQIPAVIGGDPARVSQILNNLIGNAIKFTGNGKITVVTRILRESPGDIELAFSVEDTGIGIPMEKQAHIFGVFTQASSSISRKYGGTGLGLAISKMLVELQGGQLTVESREEQGSTFSFALKFRKSDKIRLQEEEKDMPLFRNLKGINVLVVEDNLINQKIVSKLLSRWEASTDIAENGKIAVEKIRNRQFDLVLMDINMPEMNGYEATLKIREMEGEYFRELPILALTASAFVEDRKQIFACGMNGYVIKPFSPAELNRKIARFLKTTLLVN
jgi:signal transduction histidine kinase